MLESQSFRGRQATSQLCFTFARRQGLPASLHPFLDSLQQLPCTWPGLPSLHPALQTYFWNTIYLLRWSKAKVNAVASTFPPTTDGPILPNFKCQKGPPRLVFLGPPSGYHLTRYPPVAWWGVRFYFLQSVLWETLYCPRFALPASSSSFSFTLFHL